jgi:hypothetical protein
MHWIQREILKKLATSESCRYSDLKPENVDGNLFMYHLKQLMADKYIENTNKEYRLTSVGKTYLGGLRLSQGGVAAIPRLFTVIYAKNTKGEVLLYRWSRQPYLGHVSLPFNRILREQTIAQTAAETLNYKSGLTGTLDYKGVAGVMVKDEEKISSHYIAHIFELADTVKEKAVTADGLTGEPFWGSIDDFNDSELVYGTKEIIEIINTKKSPFFEEILVKK